MGFTHGRLPRPARHRDRARASRTGQPPVLAVEMRSPAMRIGLIAPPWIAVPPPAYGGTEQVIDNLARGLTALGHDVRLFTVGESTCPVPRQWLYRSPAEPMGDRFREAAHVRAAYEALAGADIIHDHTELGPLLAGRRGISHPPVVTTVHGPVIAQNRRTLAAAARHAPIVAISRAHARSFGNI